jgi:hypothetical protein
MCGRKRQRELPFLFVTGVPPASSDSPRGAAYFILRLRREYGSRARRFDGWPLCPFSLSAAGNVAETIGMFPETNL